ncbi:type II toxin-antitoxin system RelE/ParE family toxin [sulfur-oxidizing endosymbiont of Gigantopelta aegis]|uniref:type II toxin-antitoxin system RelE/ParE family toxin n=1 Tax=sulfur-oxidizing endosymbiont of Gigantopelta aegis TaxID=2794934 RepID=UPI0018DBF8DE|nr:type II toxin-antitoxin system RelE/ParE family toxin [sulfur-oxidizing endosymbiont of Gigantopelta aegis]
MEEIKFHPEVATDIKESFDWYQKQADGLGDDFLNELESAYQAVSEMPNTWPKFQNNFRRFLLSKFPFSIIYRTANEFVYVVAIMHNSRKPKYWLKRT